VDDEGFDMKDLLHILDPKMSTESFSVRPNGVSLDTLSELKGGR